MSQTKPFLHPDEKHAAISLVSNGDGAVGVWEVVMVIAMIVESIIAKVPRSRSRIVLGVGLNSSYIELNRITIGREVSVEEIVLVRDS